MSVDVKVNPPSGTITLTRRDACNALDEATVAALSEALFDLHQERRVRGVILTGSGAHFCAGLDLKQMQGLVNDESPEVLARWHQQWANVAELIEKMLRFPKPIVAAVDGCALGAGLALVLASDLVVASGTAEFGVPATRVGLIGGITAPLLNFRWGGKLAARMLLTGQSIPAEQAVALGMIDEVVDSQMIWVRANELVQQCAESPSEAIQLSKRLLNETIGEQLITQLSVGAAMGATSCTTEASHEGICSFVEKREPNWP